MNLEERILKRRQRDTISLFVFDTKLSEDGFCVIEVGSPKNHINFEMNQSLVNCLLSENVNPKQSPVIFLRDKRIHPNYITEGVENVVGKEQAKEIFKQDSSEIYNTNFDDYSQIIVDTSNEVPHKFPKQYRSFHLNDDFFHSLTSGKYLSYACMEKFSPDTIYINPANPDFEQRIKDFEGRDVILKSESGATSIGIRYVENFSQDKLQKELDNFELTESEKKQIGRDYHPFLDELLVPDMIQEYVPDTPIKSQTTGKKHTSVDRIAAVVTSHKGNISVHYIGGFHRFESSKSSQFSPICLRNKRAFTEDFSPEYEEQVIDFTQRAFHHYYNNALRIAPDFDIKGIEHQRDGNPKLHEYFI